jgi:SAM-dependent methyltransferase
MKLSELIAFRNRLHALPVSDAVQAADHKLNILMHTVNQPLEPSMVQFTDPFISTLENKLKEIHGAFNTFDHSITELKQQIQTQIAEHERYWFQESYRLFEYAKDCETTDGVLYGRQITGTKNKLTIEAEDTLKARLSNYADWRWPGMIIRPGLEDYVNTMVGCDPLYIIDRNHDLLKPCLDRFPKLYQNRLRPYITNDWSDEPFLHKIPNEQFGVCLAYNVFNFRPLEIIRRYLEEIYAKLRPGGVLLMTFNDCDNEKAVMLVEQFFASYTPGYLIRDLAQNVGFQISYTWSDNGPSVWLELCKPGEITSQRGGQVIAVANNKYDYSDDVDYRIRTVYTEEEIKSLYDPTITNSDRDRILYDILQQKNAEEYRIKLEKEAEERRINLELHEKNVQEQDQFKKEELVRLRQRALELQAGDPNLIRYGYSAEKLKTLIKQKEENK